MLKEILYIAASVILVAGIESLRIRIRRGKVKNISHNISVIIAAVACIALWFFLHRPAWYFFTPLCIGLRLLLYSPLLNLFRGLDITYISPVSSSKIDGFLKSFWLQRIAGVVIIGIVLLIKSFI